MNKQTQRGMATSAMLIVIVLIGLAASSLWFFKRGAAIDSSIMAMDTFTVQKGSFDVIIPTTGELAAIRQIEIRNEMEQRATITYVVDEGIRIKAGEVLLKFNDETILNNIKDAEDSLDSAINRLENTKATLEIRKKTRESELAKADLEITLTGLALQSWKEGEVVETRQDLALELKTAQMEFDRLQDRFVASERLYIQEFISLDEYKQDEISLVRAETRLKQANLDIEIYEKYEYKQQFEKNKSDRVQAVEERDRTQQRQDAEVRSVESDVKGAERQVQSRRERLDKWTHQLGLCEIIAPSDGLVVYASSLSTGGMGRRDEDPPMIGTEVQSMRTIMILPDTSQMIAEVKVNEALSGMIKRGQLTTIVTDAFPDTVFAGEIYSVGVLAESGGWRDPTRRDYTIKIAIDPSELASRLKPSMRCRADINVGNVRDAMYVPIQAIHRQGPVAYVWVPDGRGYSQRQVKTGRASELYVELLEGVELGDHVLLRSPEPKEIEAMLDIPAAGSIASLELSSEQTTEHSAGHSNQDQTNQPQPSRRGQSGRGRPSAEQIEKMMENMTPEQKKAMEDRIKKRQNGAGGHSEGESHQQPEGDGTQ